MNPLFFVLPRVGRNKKKGNNNSDRLIGSRTPKQTSRGHGDTAPQVRIEDVDLPLDGPVTQSPIFLNPVTRDPYFW